MVILTSLVLGILLGAQPAMAAGPLYPCDSERLGFGALTEVRGSPDSILSYNVAALKAGWYVNWGTTPAAPHPASMDFAQILRTSNLGYYPTGQNLAGVIQGNPGSLWLIGNEPDSPYQDNTLPEKYALVYHQAYLDIKALDPTAQIAIGGIVQATPLRMQWLDRVWNTYQATYGEAMPVDVWNIHAFALREVRPGLGTQCMPAGAQEGGDWGAAIPPGITANCGQWVEIDGLDRMDLFREQIVRFRTWMKNHGQQNKPLVISEYGILFNAELGYGYDRVKNYMLNTFNHLTSARDTSIGYPADDYRLVQRWAWYSLNDDNFVWGTTYSALMNPQTKAINNLGRDFGNFASARACSYVDLAPAALRVSNTTPVAYGQTGAFQVTLDVKNLGNKASASSQVKLWDGDPASGGVLIATASLQSVPARYVGQATATFNWSALALGQHNLVARVDTASQVTEFREDNNALTLPVSFGSYNLAVGPAGWQLDAGPLRAGETTRITLQPVSVSVQQPTAATTGLRIVPPGYHATWFDGDPNSGGSMITDIAMPAAPSFGVTSTVPAQAWASVITANRVLWLVVAPNASTPETVANDNRVQLPIAAATDLSLLTFARVGPIPVVANGELADLHVRFQVVNRGTLAPQTPIQVSLFAGGGNPEVGRVALGASGNWTSDLTWPALARGYQLFSAEIDADHTTAETDETNNTITGNLMVAGLRHYLPVSWR